MKQKGLILTLCFVLLATVASAQNDTTDATKMKEEPAADYSKDHKSIDSTIKALYDVISGPKEKKRDWARFNALFYKGARLIPSGKGQDGVTRARMDAPDEYAKRSEPFFQRNGFYEQEIARKTDVFGNIAHVFTTYEARFSLEDEKPFMRGINSIQLLNDGKRWWILSVFWQQESKESPIPEKYLMTNN
ncbi:MAG: hypothetical protein HKN33_16645 [Pyrinomonadaceae bacterium]|nr:hypothetical protein [Pyrinomonadaceae bacterium]